MTDTVRVRGARGGEGPEPAGDDGRLSAPGALAGTVVVDVGDAGLPDEPLAEWAIRHGLRPSASRPPVFAYLRQLWQRRHFITGFATAMNVSMYTEARLGQLWQVLTPLLNVGVYWLIFGVILGTNRGVPNYVAFLVTGIFVFNFTQTSFLVASRVMNDSLPLIRVLHFPRACLPLGYVLIELQQLVISFAVLFTIILISGEPVTWYWLLAIPALVLQTMFNIGGAFILARLGAGFVDFSQLLPFVVRTWLYVSGVLFSIPSLTLIHGGILARHLRLSWLLMSNPASVYISLIRNAILSSQRLSYPGSMPFNARKCALYSRLPDQYPTNSGYCHPVVSPDMLWVYGAGWAVVALVAGFLIFWQAETRYGRG